MPSPTEKTSQVPPQNRATEHLANERTFLAWIRTSIAVVSFGFVTGKLSIMLPSFADSSPEQVMAEAAMSRKFPVGLWMIGFGGMLALLAAWRYFVVARAIERGAVRPDWTLVGIISGVVALLACVMILYILTKPEMM